jgi:outer membrane protein assembly factor BamB
MNFFPLRRQAPAADPAALLVAFLFALAPAPRDQPARDWPMFGGTAQRNLANTVDTNIPDEWAVGERKKNVKWKAALGGASHSAPVIAGGRVFVGTNNGKPRAPAVTGDKGVMMCFDEKTGAFLWQIVHDKLDDAGLDIAEQGVASSPTVDGDRLYYVSNRCELVCADVKGDPGTKKGKILWSLDMIEELKVYPSGRCSCPGYVRSTCSPLVLDDLVYVVTGNGVDGEKPPPSPEAPSFLAVDKNTGKPAWQSNLPGKNILDGQWGSPAAAEVNGQKQVIFPGGDGWLYAFDARKGDLVWKFDCNPKASNFFKKGTRNYLVATPVVAGGKVYVGVGRHPEEGPGVGHLWCIDPSREPKNKDKDLSPAGDNFDPKADANKDSGLVWHVGGLVNPAPTDGSNEFRFGRTASTVAVHDGLVYAAETGGYLHCFDARTGEGYWQHDLGGSVCASPYYVDGKVFIGTTSGDLFIFTAGKEKKNPKRIDMDSNLKTAVTVAGGVLYVNTGEALYAIAAK